MTTFQKLPKNVGDLGKIIVATGFEKLPKVENIAQSGHTACKSHDEFFLIEYVLPLLANDTDSCGQSFFKKWAILGLFFVYFRLFKQTLQFLQQINVKNVHPVYGAGIRTHDLWNMSLLP